MQGIRCDDGPQVYREWLGIQFVDPWIKVKRCISYRCKPSKVNKITKPKSLKDMRYTTCTVNEHVKCINS